MTSTISHANQRGLLKLCALVLALYLASMLTACASPTALRANADSCWYADTVRFNDATTGLPETLVAHAHRAGCQ